MVHRALFLVCKTSLKYSIVGSTIDNSSRIHKLIRNQLEYTED